MAGQKIITYPRAEVRYLPQNLISDVPQIVAGLQVGQSFSAIPVPEPPAIRRGASGAFYDKGLEGMVPSRRHPQRQHDRQIAVGVWSGLLSSDVERKNDRRDRAGLSGRADA